MNLDLQQQLKKQIPQKHEKRDQVKQLALKGLVGFLVIMMVLTALSKTADSLTTPQVTVGSPKTGRIEQKVEATGSLKPRDEESMEVGSGLIVKDIFVEEGDRVKRGDTLIELDAKELQEKLETTISDLKKLKLRLEQMGLNEDFSETATPTEKVKEKIARLQEDKVFLIQKEDTKIARQEAKLQQTIDDLEQAKEDLEQFKASNLEDQIKKTEEEVKNAQKALEEQKYEKDKAIQRAEKALNDAKEQLWLTQGDATVAIQNYERAKMEYDFTRTDWERKVKDAEATLKKAKEKLEKLQNGEIDEELLKQEEEKVKTAEKQIEEQKRVLEDTMATKEEAIREMDRQIQDAEKELLTAEKEEANNGLKEEQDANKEAIDRELMVLDIEAKQKEIDRIKVIIAEGGQIVAPTDGMISDVKVEKGSTTSGGELLTFIGDNSEYVLEVEVSSEDGKYIAVGDTVEVRFEGEKTPVENTVVEKIVHVPGSTGGKKKISIVVPDGEPGMRATMKASQESDKYNNILPIEAVREANGSYYVLVAKKKTTTLGEQMVVERVDVMVLDKNANSIAVQGAFGMQDQIIIQSNKPIQAGDRVRLIEQ